MLPPMLLHLHVSTADRPRVGIWLPLFLIWLLLLPVLILALALTVLTDFFLLLFGHGFQGYTLLLVNALALLGYTRGTEIHIHNATQDIDIQFV